jgi:tetratricopeptide (TPR) repeat protein
MVLQALHRHDDAIRHYRQSLVVNPNDSEALNNLGTALNALGRFDAAAECYRRAVAINPGNVEAHLNLGGALRALGAAEEAIRCYERAIAVSPRRADIHIHLGETLQTMGRHSQAAHSYDIALSIKPDYPEAHMNLGNALQALSEHEAAIRCYKRALVLKPDYSKGHYNLAITLQALNRHDEAVDCYQRALALEPRYAEALTGLGNAMQALKRYDESIHLYEQAIACGPNAITARINLANTFQVLDRFRQALEQYECVLSIDPSNTEAKWNRSLLLLRMGRFSEGWDAYESRWVGGIKGAVLKSYPQPRWCGEYVDGVLLAWAEQGLGDHILYSGMVPELRKCANSLVLEVEPRLVQLFSRSFPAVEVMPLGDEIYGGGIDAQTPLASAGKYLRASWEAFPRHERGYLIADQSRCAGLRSRLSRHRGALVGISWCSQHPLYGSSKSARLVDFRAILETPELHAVNLQYGDTLEERAMIEQDLGVTIENVDEIDNTKDIDGLAALIAACDLVVTVSNTTAHLAGALGTPTWVLVPHGNARVWYWFQDKAGSPWYPHVHVRHQACSEPWADLVSSATHEIANFLRSHF